MIRTLINDPLFDDPVDLSAYSGKFSVYLKIVKTHDVKSLCEQIVGTFTVVCDTFFAEMLRTVKLDYQICSRTKEINDIAAYLFLTPELNGICAQKTVP